MHTYNTFATLTYDDEHVPFNLCYRDFQLFMKRLRKRGFKVRYYVASEYGSELRTFRPHFHVIFFGQANSQSFRLALQEAWSNGFTTTSALNNARCKYACGYVDKKLEMDNADNVHDVLPFCRMSRNPGLAYNFLMAYKSDIMANGFVAYDGKRYPLPRYFVQVLFDIEPVWYRKWRLDNVDSYNSRLLNCYNNQVKSKGQTVSFRHLDEVPSDVIYNAYLLHYNQLLQRVTDLQKKHELFLSSKEKLAI